MELRLDNLNVRKEKAYFIIAAVLAVIVWGFITLTIFGPVIALVMAFFTWLANGLLVAHLRSNCIKVDNKQMPVLYKTFGDVCSKFNIPVPELYILQSGGLLNAFAYRHSGRNFVVLYSNLIEDCALDADEMRFLLGHEIGHIKSRHIFKQVFLMPVLWLPLLGSAYHRACEVSCDRYGAFSANNMGGAIRALLILAGGQNISKVVDAEKFSQQSTEYRGFFVSWHELISAYPTLSRRVADLLAIKNGHNAPAYYRNPLSYLFALFSFGGGVPQVGGVMMVVAIVGLLSAIAVPNFLRTKIAANDFLAESTVRDLSTAAEAYAAASGYYPEAIEELTNANPSYLNSRYCSETISGYYYSCYFSKSGYEFQASPVSLGTSGTKTFTIKTGGMLNK